MINKTYPILIIIFCSALIPSSLFASKSKVYKPQVTDGQVPQKTESLTFTRLLFRAQTSIEIAVAPEQFRVAIIEDLRKKGYNALGAENLLFDQDKSQNAKLALGGTIQNLHCKELNAQSDACTIYIDWELFDRSKQKIIYRHSSAYTQHYNNYRRTVENLDDWLYRLVQGALYDLIDNDRFLVTMRKDYRPPNIPRTFTAATFKQCPQSALTLPQDVDTVLNATVMVRTENGGGSGAFISPDGVIITASHVLQNQSTAVVILHDGTELNATVLRNDPGSDTALLKVDIKEGKCIPLANSSSLAGQTVYIIGTPVAEELAFSVSKGIISSIREIEGDRFIQTDASMNPGNSGGPMVNDTGQLIGIADRKVVSWAIEGLGFGIPMDVALQKLAISSGEYTHIPPQTFLPLSCWPDEIATQNGICIPAEIPQKTTPHTRSQPKWSPSSSTPIIKKKTEPTLETEISPPPPADDVANIGIVVNLVEIIVAAAAYQEVAIPLNLQIAGKYAGLDILGVALVGVGGVINGGVRILPMGKGLKGFYLVPRLGGGTTGFVASGELGWAWNPGIGMFNVGLGGGYAVGTEVGVFIGTVAIGFGG